MYDVIYINLDSDTDRRAFMDQQLTQLGIPYSRLSAIDGRTQHVPEYNDDLSNAVNNTSLTQGEIGCAASHRRAHQMALEQSNDYMLILEDDVCLPDDFKSIIEREIKNNIRTATWEYLTFDYPPGGVIFIRRWFDSVLLRYTRAHKDMSYLAMVWYFLYHMVKFFYITPLVLGEALRDRLYRLFGHGAAVMFLRPLYFTGCYIITKEAARKLLSLETPIRFASDRVVNQARIHAHLWARGYCPLIVGQQRERFTSSILQRL